MAKEVPRSRTFSSGVSGSYNPGEPALPDRADIAKEPGCSQQVPRCQCKTPAGCCSDPSRSPVSCGFSPKAPFSAGHTQVPNSKDLPTVAPNTALQSELSVEARRILAAKALASLNECAEKEEVKRKVEMWQVLVFHLIVFVWEIHMAEQKCNTCYQIQGLQEFEDLLV